MGTDWRVGDATFCVTVGVTLQILTLNMLLKVDSDSEINWDEDEDLGDTEIPGIFRCFDLWSQILLNQTYHLVLTNISKIICVTL